MVRSALVVITVLGVGATFYWFYSTLPEEPQVQTEYWGLSLDSSKSDVRFLKGEPNVIEGFGEYAEAWRFHNGYGTLTDRNDMYVLFDDENTIRNILYLADSDESQSIKDRYSIQGIRAGVSTSEDVLEKFGKPSLITTNDDETVRDYYFDQYDLLFSLESNRVKALGITSQGKQKESSESGDTER